MAKEYLGEGVVDLGDGWVEVDGVRCRKAEPTYTAVKADPQTVKLIKEYVRRQLEIQAKIDALKEELKELKNDYLSEGINVKAVNRALANYKRIKKLSPTERGEMEMIQDIFEEDADIQAKIAESIS